MFLLAKLFSLFQSHPYLCAIAIATAIACNFYAKRRRSCNLPGPYGLPLVGYMPFLSTKPYEDFTKLAEKYGPIYQVKVGRTNLVIISSLELGMDAFNSDLAFHGTSNNFALRAFADAAHSAFTFQHADGSWKVLRRIGSRSLGLFASSRNCKLENVVSEAQDYLESNLDSHLNQPFNPKMLVLQTVSAVIGSILFGFNFDVENPVLKKCLDITKIFSLFIKVGGLADVVPYPEFFYASSIKAFKVAMLPIANIADTQMVNHQYSGSEEDVRDVADALIKYCDDANLTELSAVGIDKKKIREISSDLFGAGFATTSELFHWFLNLMAVNPAVQQRCQREIDQYLIDGRKVTLEDRGKMPYIDATITEMSRVITFLPLGLAHSMMADATFRGYFLPKNTEIHLNMFAIHHDPSVFPEPEKFMPERFLREDGSFDTEKSTKVIQFGVGRRRCIGENLARQELFMLFVSTLQKYDIRIAQGQTVDFSHGDYGISRIAHDLDLMFSHRK